MSENWKQLELELEPIDKIEPVISNDYFMGYQLAQKIAKEFKQALELEGLEVNKISIKKENTNGII